MSVKLFSESQQGMDLCLPVLNGFHPVFFFFFCTCFYHSLRQQMALLRFFFITSICKQLNSVLGR